jgi:hypothetical protein
MWSSSIAARHLNPHPCGSLEHSAAPTIRSAWCGRQGSTAARVRPPRRALAAFVSRPKRWCVPASVSSFEPFPDYTPRPDRCPNCQRDTTLQLLDRQMAWPEWTTNLAPPLTEYVILNVWRCTYCGRTSIVAVAWDGADEQFRPHRESGSSTRIDHHGSFPRRRPRRCARSTAKHHRQRTWAHFVGQQLKSW